jgi:hypothetical protein
LLATGLASGACASAVNGMAMQQAAAMIARIFMTFSFTVEF